MKCHDFANLTVLVAGALMLPTLPGAGGQPGDLPGVPKPGFDHALKSRSAGAGPDATHAPYITHTDMRSCCPHQGISTRKKQVQDGTSPRSCRSGVRSWSVSLPA